MSAMPVALDEPAESLAYRSSASARESGCRLIEKLLPTFENVSTKNRESDVKNAVQFVRREILAGRTHVHVAKPNQISELAAEDRAIEGECLFGSAERVDIRAD
jgi:hypothetical protein